ncbi:MAG: hypothetical protein PHX74_10945 [Candidatus Sumerlaeales bacterium]|nr:hypothetical protein [Candidatus Sumerlaeales bacterium]MDD4280235.1 hypothetical protein [Candidatus Sumerlaeales bacterium]
MTATIKFDAQEIIQKTTSGDLVSCPITMNGKAIGFIEKANKKTGVCEGKIYVTLSPEFFNMGQGKMSITGLELLTK